MTVRKTGEKVQVGMVDAAHDIAVAGKLPVGAGIAAADPGCTVGEHHHRVGCLPAGMPAPFSPSHPLSGSPIQRIPELHGEPAGRIRSAGVEVHPVRNRPLVGDRPHRIWTARVQCPHGDRQRHNQGEAKENQAEQEGQAAENPAAGRARAPGWRTPPRQAEQSRDARDQDQQISREHTERIAPAQALGQIIDHPQPP